MLSVRQHQFIAARLCERTDSDAAEASGIPLPTVYRWKSEDDEFKEVYANIGKDNVEYARSASKDYIGKAVQTLYESMEATKTARSGAVEKDFDARLEGAKAILAIHGVSTAKTDIDAVGEIVVRLVRDAKAPTGETDGN